MNNRFKNLVELKKNEKVDTPENKKDTNTNNIFIKSETKYFENKRKKDNSFVNSKKKERYNSFTRKFQNNRKEPKPEKIKPDITNNDEFPPLQ